MSDLGRLPTWDDDGRLLVVVEAPRGSATKLEYDPALGAFVVKRALPPGTVYPYDWGFVPSTRHLLLLGVGMEMHATAILLSRD